MRVGKRQAWGAILIALFILPLLKPAGVPAVEGPVGAFFAWTADVLPSISSTAPRAAGDPDGAQQTARVRALEEERSKLLDQLLRTRRRMQDLGALKDALDRSELDHMPRAVLAPVLRAHDPVPGRRSILIGRGAADGLAVGHAVVMGGVYLGRVRIVHTHSARVQLLTDPHSQLEVFVRTSKGHLLRGYTRRAGSKDGQDQLQVEFIRLRGDVGIIRPGASIFTSNFDERVPAHLLVGTVAEVSDPDRDRMPKLTMRPSMNLDRSTEVVVLIPESRRHRAGRVLPSSMLPSSVPAPLSPKTR